MYLYTRTEFGLLSSHSLVTRPKHFCSTLTSPGSPLGGTAQCYARVEDIANKEVIIHHYLLLKHRDYGSH